MNVGYRRLNDIVDSAFGRFARFLAEAAVRAFLTFTRVEDERELNEAVSSIKLFAFFFGDNASLAVGRGGWCWLHRCIAIGSRWGSR